MAKKHSVIGASSCERWWNCPGSVKLIAKAPKQAASKYADEGTAAHQLAETCLLGGTYPELWLDETIEAGDSKIKVTEEMVEAVQVYLDCIHQDMRDTGVGLEALKVEHKFALTRIDPEAFGTCDAVLATPGAMYVYDFKYGAGVPVEAADNRQLLYYALGAAQSGLGLGPPKRFTITIVQPRAPHRDGPIRRAHYTTEELAEFSAGLAKAVQRVRQNDEALKAGPWCKFCAAKGMCPEARREVQRSAKLDFAKTAKPLPDPATLPPSELARVLDHANYLKDWVGAVQGYAHTLAERGVEIPGWKLVDGRVNRAWADEKAVEKAYVLELGDKLYAPRKLVSPAQLEKILPKKRHAEIEPLLAKKEKPKVLAPVADARERRQSDIEADFAAVKRLTR